jgi:gas vesicle protein
MSFNNQDRLDNGHDRAFLAGLVAGTVMGAGIGLLLAPKTGAEMRSQLGTSAEKLQRNAVDSYQRASARVINLVQRSRGAIQKGREAFDEARDAADRTDERFQSAIDQSSR